MRRPWVIIGCLVIGAAALWLYYFTRLPPGIEAKGDAERLLPWMSLAGAVVSLLTGIVSLGLKVVELRLRVGEARTKVR
jgi:hypothetical protein